MFQLFQAAYQVKSIACSVGNSLFQLVSYKNFTNVIIYSLCSLSWRLCIFVRVQTKRVYHSTFIFRNKSEEKFEDAKGVIISRNK